MATIKTTIKRRNGTGWDELRPKTEVDQITDFDANVPDNLDDLTNVNAPSPSDGQALVWDNATSKWIPGTVAVDTSAFVTKIALTGRNKRYRIFSVSNSSSSQKILHAKIVSSNNYAATTRRNLTFMFYAFSTGHSVDSYYLGENNNYPVYFELYEDTTLGLLNGYIVMSNYTDQATLIVEHIGNISLELTEVSSPSGTLDYNSNTYERQIWHEGNFDPDGKVSKSGDTMTGGLNLPSYAIDTDFYHTWTKKYVVNTTTPATLLYKDGNALPNGGVYRFTAHIAGTGTDNMAQAVFWNVNGTWKVNVTGQSGTSSNHPEFVVSGGVPKLITDHSSNYTISVFSERMELEEGTGTDNAQFAFGAGSFLGSVNGVLRYNSGGGSDYTAGSTVWHSGNDGSGSGLDADTLDTYHASDFVAVTGDTMTGNLTLSGNNVNTSLTINSGTASSIINMNGTNTSFIEKDTGNDLYIAHNVSDKNIHFRVNDGGTQNVLMTLNGSSSRVGIGTTTPSEKLQVEGDVLISGTGGTIGTSGAITNAYLKIGTTLGFDPNQMLFSSAGYINSTQWLALGGGGDGTQTDILITSDHKVGIGTTTPSEKLDVDGNIAVSGTVDGVDIAAFKTAYDSHSHSQYAPLASPALTGTPTAPTASSNTNNTQIATTAFVSNKIAGIAGGLNFKGTVSLATSKTGDDLYGTGSGQISSSGDYLIVSNAGDITNPTTRIITLAAQSPGDESDSTLPITLEVGDWIMYQSFSSQTLTVVLLNNNDASKAAAVHTHSQYLEKAGGTMTGELIIDNSTTQRIRLYTESGTSQIADTFADTTTDKSYIYFDAGTSSNDPGFIMHETSNSETNEGVLHLVPSDDNSYGDYVSIHGTNDPDKLKLHTDGTIEGVKDITLSGNITVGGTVDGVDIAAFKTAYDSHAHSQYAPLASPAFTGDVTMSGSLEIAGDLEVVGNTIGFVDNNFDARIQVSDSNPNGTGAVFNFYGDGASRNATLSAEQFDGNAATTTKWLTARTITLGGDLSGSVSLDGSANVTLSAQVANNSHQHSQLYENSTITYGASYVQWTDQSGTGGAGTNGTAPRNPANGWYHNLIMNHANSTGYYSQISTGLNTSDIYFTRVQGGVAKDWQRIFADDYHPNADKWTTARTLSLTGDVTGSVSWDGSANASMTTTVVNDSHNHDHSDGNFTVNGDLYGKSVNGQYSNIYRIGGLYFTWDSDTYGTNTNHSIRSTYGDSYGDHITLNSYGHIRMNIDSNNNGTNYFEVGGHTTGTSNTYFQISDTGTTIFPGLSLGISNTNADPGTGTYFRGNSTHFVLGLDSGNTLYLNYGNSAGNFRTYGTHYHNDNAVGTPWGSSNDGSGSGLDADTLDTKHASDFVAVTGDTMTGNLTFSNDTTGVEFYGDNALKKVSGTGLVMTTDSTRGLDILLQFERGSGGTKYKAFHDGYHPNADKWTTARTITLGGDLTGSVSLDGSANVTLTAAVADNSHSHTISNVSNLQAALDDKAEVTYTSGSTTTDVSTLNFSLSGSTLTITTS